MSAFARWLASIREHAHRHHRAYHVAHNSTHVSYLTLVATHGPYSYAAAALLVIVVLGWLLHMEEG